jgi:glutathione S-transferase
MVKLYYVPRTRATRPRWLLEELGLPHELVRLDAKKGETRTPEHRARHPLGHVPVLEDGDVRIFESSAICFYLAEKYGDGRLLPPPATAKRAEAYQWLSFALSELEPPLVEISAEHRKPEGQADTARIEAAKERFRAAAKVVDGALNGPDFLLGATFSAADVVVGAILSWGKFLSGLDGMPAALAYVASLKERPAFKKATAD